MTPGSTALSDRQFALLEGLAAAGGGPAALLAAIEGSDLFSHDEADHYAQANGSKSNSGGGGKGGKDKGGGSGGGGGGGEWGQIRRLLPWVGRGDPNQQTQSGGLPYSPGTQLNPITSTTGGGSPLLIVGAIVVVGVGAFLLLHKKPKKGEPKK